MTRFKAAFIKQRYRPLYWPNYFNLNMAAIFHLPYRNLSESGCIPIRKDKPFRYQLTALWATMYVEELMVCPNALAAFLHSINSVTWDIHLWTFPYVSGDYVLMHLFHILATETNQHNDVSIFSLLSQAGDGTCKWRQPSSKYNYRQYGL